MSPTPPLRLLFVLNPAGGAARLLEPIEQADPQLRIETVSDAEALEAALTAGDFDVAVTPESAGWTDAGAVLAAVRSRLPDRPVILLVSPSAEDLALEALGEGTEDYVFATPEDLPRLPARARSAVARAGRRLWAFAPVGLYKTTPDGVILDASRDFVEKLGYPDRKSLLATRAEHLYVDPEDRGRWRALLEREGTVRGFETRLRRADGSFLWVRDSARAVRDREGRLVRYDGFIEDIHAYKEAAEALRQSEERFRSLVENASDIMVEMGTGRRVRYASPSVERILGYRADELLDADAFDLIHPDDIARVAEALASASLHPETTAMVDYRVRAKDGSWHLLESRGRAIASPTGPARIVIVARDITERVETDAALRESEERYRRLVELSPDGIVVHRHGRFVYLNAAASQILGAQDPAELLGRPVIDSVHPESRGTVAERIRSIVDDGKEAPLIEEKFLRLDGSVVDVEVAAIPFVYGGGPAVQVVIRDITARKQAAGERSTLTRAVEQAGECIVITDTQGAIVYVNPAFERITGYSRAEALGQNPSILKSGKHDASFYQEMWATLASGEVWSGRLINKAKDGSLYEEEATISPVRDARGQVVNYVAVKRDVTREVLLEQQFLQAQKMEAVGRLAGGVAHDFNNLLGVISGYGELVLRRLPAEDPLWGKVDQIVKASNRAASLTRQLLAFSRRQLLQPKVLDLNLLVSDLGAMLQRVIGEDVELVTVLADGLGCVEADMGQLEQVVMNLVINARDAMPAGGRLTIETRNVDLDDAYVREHLVANVGHYVMLAVSDNGVGMDADTKAQIFEPFFTTKELGKGTGLGLSTVYGIVKQSGGYVWVYSEPGRGTTFKVYLPRVNEVERVEEARPRPPRGSETILLVEDEESLREVIRETLESNGHTVLAAGGGDEALRIAKEYQGPIHLMITDVVMPGLGGREVAERAAALRADMRLLYVSGYPDGALGREGVLAPGTAFLEKPFSADALLLRVRQVMDAN